MAGDGEGMVDAAQSGHARPRPARLLLGVVRQGPGRAARRCSTRQPTLVRHRQQPRPGPAVEHAHRDVGLHRGSGHPPADDATSPTPASTCSPDATADAQTVTVLEGAKSVAGQRLRRTRSPTRPRTAPTRAFDGDPHTAWRTGEFDDVRGDRIRIVLDHPITTDHVNLVQVLEPPNDRYITRRGDPLRRRRRAVGRRSAREPDRRRSDGARSRSARSARSRSRSATPTSVSSRSSAA